MPLLPCLSVDSTVAVPVDAIVAVPVDAIVAVSVDATVAVLVDATVAVSVYATVAVSVDATVAVSVDATPTVLSSLLSWLCSSSAGDGAYSVSLLLSGVPQVRGVRACWRITAGWAGSRSGHVVHPPPPPPPPPLPPCHPSEAHLKPTNNTLFLPDGTNHLCDGHFQFSDGLGTILIHVVLQKPPEIFKKIKKIWCLRRDGDHLEHVL